MGIDPMGIESGPSGTTSRREEFAPIRSRDRWCDGVRGACERHPRVVVGLFVAIVLAAALKTVAPHLGSVGSSGGSSSRSGDSGGWGATSSVCFGMGPTFPKYAAIGLADESESLARVVGVVAKSDEVLLERTWEPRIDNGYPSVEWVDNKWRLWYSTCVQLGCRVQDLLYATSADGLKWEKDSLGGERNIIGERWNGTGVTYVRETKQFVAFGSFCLALNKTEGTNGSAEAQRACGGLHYELANIAVSRTGVKGWNGFAIAWNATAPQQRYDCHNNLYYDDARKLFVLTTRRYSNFTGRAVGIAVADSLHKNKFEDYRFAPPVKKTLVGTLGKQYYSQVTFPWHDLVLGIVAVFYNASGTIHARLAFAPEPQKCWQFVNKTRDFIPLGPAFDSHIVFAARPVRDDPLLRIYYMGGDGPHGGKRNTSLGLATIHPDRLAGLSPAAGEPYAVFNTRPLTCNGTTLTVTFDATSPSDCVRLLKVSDIDGTEKSLTYDEDHLPGLCASSRDDAALPGLDLSRFLGRLVSLKFKLTGHAILYTVAFDTAAPPRPTGTSAPFPSPSP
mmetsp:Transcript_8143/g.25111  ORF Transcript_8143/g.25111 Transcript_8143/m.25111 type:complete len:562 (+) Transcript_8143:164-1849(+)